MSQPFDPLVLRHCDYDAAVAAVLPALQKMPPLAEFVQPIPFLAYPLPANACIRARPNPSKEEQAAGAALQRLAGDLRRHLRGPDREMVADNFAHLARRVWWGGMRFSTDSASETPHYDWPAVARVGTSRMVMDLDEITGPNLLVALSALPALSKCVDEKRKSLNRSDLATQPLDVQCHVSLPAVEISFFVTVVTYP